MNILQLLSRLDELGITIEWVNKKLKIKAPEGILNPVLISQLTG
jgi:hypothetical protein